jgi:hypothetical protein
MSDAVAASAADAPEADLELMFAKKKKKKAPVAAAAPTETADGGASGGAERGGASLAAPASAGAAFLEADGDPEQSYDDMLSRVYELLNGASLLLFVFQESACPSHLRSPISAPHALRPAL